MADIFTPPTFLPSNIKNRRKKLNLKIELPTKNGKIETARSKRNTPHTFDGKATEVIPNLFVGDIIVAHNDDILKELGITHILNCVAQNVTNAFPNEFEYASIEMKDSPSEDIFCLFFDAIDFIEKAIESGRVLIHCKCGISRSTAITMAFLMYKYHYSYQKAFETLHCKRSVCAPNAGFIMALQSWQDHLSGKPLVKPRLYRVEIHESKNNHFITKQVNSLKGFTSIFSFIIHTNETLYLWIGNQCSVDHIQSAQQFVNQLQKYEKAPNSLIILEEGDENDEFNHIIKEFV